MISSHRLIKLSCHLSQDSRKNSKPQKHETLTLTENRWWGRLGSSTHRRDSGSLKWTAVPCGQVTAPPAELGTPTTEPRDPHRDTALPPQGYDAFNKTRHLQQATVSLENGPRYPQHQTAASKAGLQHQKTNWAAKIRTGLRPHSCRKLHAEIVTKEDDNNRMCVKG